MSDQSAAESNQLADQCFKKGDFHGCIHWAARAEDLARQTDENRQELWAIEQQSIAWANLGEPKKGLDAATRLMKQAKRYSQDDYYVEGTRLFASRAADIDLRNRWREIRPILLEGLETARRLGNNFEEVYHLYRLGGYAWWVGEEEQGLAWLQEALNALRPDTDDPQAFFRYAINNSLSGLMLKRGNHADAVRYAQIALGAAQEGGNPDFVASAQLTLAWAERARGELAEALRLVEEVLSQARQMGWKGQEQDAEYLRGELLREMGHPEQAELAARRALELAREMKFKEEEVECLLSLGQVLLALKRREEAREVLQQARRLSQERDYADHFQKAEELLTGCQ